MNGHIARDGQPLAVGYCRLEDVRTGLRKGCRSILSGIVAVVAEGDRRWRSAKNCPGIGERALARSGPSQHTEGGAGSIRIQGCGGWVHYRRDTAYDVQGKCLGIGAAPAI